ncbi:hypothetical protein VNO77_39393 [Canavalia gladiata]|uniref:Uncharacterized protein n=1 Tax=Canavalia gladiata TaxID=3824 RepID=A0AAN9PX36_CANGL
MLGSSTVRVAPICIPCGYASAMFNLSKRAFGHAKKMSNKFRIKVENMANGGSSVDGNKDGEVGQEQADNQVVASSVFFNVRAS